LQAGLPAGTIQTAAAVFMKEPSACDEGLGDIALMHAKVYCFAHQFLFSGLEDLALQRLTQLLLKCDTPTDPFFLGLAPAIFIRQNGTKNSPEQEDTSLILIGSGAAFLDCPRAPQYCASKWAMRGIMHSLRRTAFFYGSRVNVISPW
jgi:NAD(P)-dependent dehydrogenase (short-subunit alcohol dehydrogenase family)